MHHDTFLPNFKVSSHGKAMMWTDDGRGNKIAKYSDWGPQSGKSPGFSVAFFMVGALAAWALVAYKVRRERLTRDPTNGRDYSDRDRYGFDEIERTSILSFGSDGDSIVRRSPRTTTITV